MINLINYILLLFKGFYIFNSHYFYHKIKTFIGFHYFLDFLAIILINTTFSNSYYCHLTNDSNSNKYFYLLNLHFRHYQINNSLIIFMSILI
jgi:hypothetical protein